MLTAADPDFAPLAPCDRSVWQSFMSSVSWLRYAYNRMMVNVTQGTLRNLRDDLFAHMEKLPIQYFDTHAHGDIMSIYTNDIDTLRQMISQSIPQVLNSAITIVSVFVSMLILNIPLTIVTLYHGGDYDDCATKKVAGLSGNYLCEAAEEIWVQVNGYIEEMMDGQKVVKGILP